MAKVKIKTVWYAFPNVLLMPVDRGIETNKLIEFLRSEGHSCWTDGIRNERGEHTSKQGIYTTPQDLVLIRLKWADVSAMEEGAEKYRRDMLEKYIRSK